MARTDQGNPSPEDDKLANVYFSYASLEDAYAANAVPGGATNGKPGARRPGTATKKAS